MVIITGVGLSPRRVRARGDPLPLRGTRRGLAGIAQWLQDAAPPPSRATATSERERCSAAARGSVMSHARVHRGKMPRRPVRGEGQPVSCVIRAGDWLDEGWMRQPAQETLAFSGDARRSQHTSPAERRGDHRRHLFISHPNLRRLKPTCTQKGNRSSELKSKRGRQLTKHSRVIGSLLATYWQFNGSSRAAHWQPTGSVLAAYSQ